MKKRILSKILCVLLVFALLISSVACGEPHVHSFGEYSIVKQATCMEKGLKKRTCSCGEEETVEIPYTAHAFGEWQEIVNPTCDTDGVKAHKQCSVCNKNFDANDVEIADLTIEKWHEYTAWEDEISATYESEGVKGHYGCLHCSKVFDANYNELSSLKIDKLTDTFDQTSGDFPTLITENGISYVQFGYYPQTVVSDTTVVEKLDSAIKSGLTTNAYGYYQMDNNYYAKKTATPYTNGESYLKFTDGSTIENGKDYYFKVEPVLWRVVKNNSGVYTLIADKVIDVHIFDPLQFPEEVEGVTQNPNDYSISEIRSWLNGEFLSTAFKTYEKAFISLSQVDNGVYNDTEDKIFLPSLEDMYNEEYGFSSDAERMALSTDYVRACGTYMVPMVPEGKQIGYAKYWLRTAGEINEQNVAIINCNGASNENQSRIFTCTVRPMVVIKNI